jgi:protein SCO1/2
MLSLSACVLTAQTPGAISLNIPDVTLRDQNGAPVLFPELVRNRMVVMNFVFTSCTTICSPMGANFGALQARLGEKSDVRLISISIDPAMDTPARLRKWGERFHSGSSWTLLTGEPADVEKLLRALGVYTPNRFSHAPLILVGNAATNRWTRANGLLPPAEIVPLVEALRTPPKSLSKSSEVTRK